MTAADRAKTPTTKAPTKPDTARLGTGSPTQDELEAATSHVSKKHGEALKRLAKR